MIELLRNMEALFSLPPMLLVALCGVESNHRSIVNPQDGGSPSLGICQVKEETARMLGFSGGPEALLNPKTNAHYAAKYLRQQIDRYEGNGCHGLAAYNSGSIRLTKEGRYKNERYVRKVLTNWGIFSLRHRPGGLREYTGHSTSALSRVVRPFLRAKTPGGVSLHCAQDLFGAKGGDL